MARGITQDQVNEAIGQIIAAGGRPTIERVRAVLGTGSPNTLIRLLDVWWSELAGRLHAQRQSAAVPDAPAEVTQAASTLWEAALKAAQKQASAVVEQERNALAEQRATLDAADALRSSGLRIAEETAGQARQQANALRERVADLSMLVETQTAQTADLARRLDEVEDSRTHLSRELAEVRQAFEIERVQATRQFSEELDRHRQAEDRWLREVDELRQERIALRKQLQLAESRAAKAQESETSRAAVLVRDVANAEARAAAAETRVQGLTAELDRLHVQLRDVLTPPKGKRRGQTSASLGAKA